MAAKFGTSGLRGLVSELTPDVVAAHVRAFLRAAPHGDGLCIGRDLRGSSPAIAAVVADAARAEGVNVTDCGAVPTPALAAWAMARGKSAVMVTGSHIPADRNGLKFYTPVGEITAADQAGIEALAPQLLVPQLPTPRLLAPGHLALPPQSLAPPPSCQADCAAAFRDRYLGAYGSRALAGLRLGLYEHSTVARDLLGETLTALGAEVVPLGRASKFLAVDTEAVDARTRDALRDWTRLHHLDAIVSADGDADRPLVADDRGRVVPGDVLGALTARALGASHVMTPISSNSLVADMGFASVIRTRIGSPHVIAAMLAAEAPGARVAGYEANGGFLLGFAAHGPAGPLPALATRDSFLPVIAPLAQACARGIGLAALAGELPARFTAADRAAEVPTRQSAQFIARLAGDVPARAAFFAELGAESGLDLTDGLRVSFASGDIVHLRPSGNAPELRCYAESDNEPRSGELVRFYLEKARAACNTP